MQDPEFNAKYKNKIQVYLHKGYLRKLTKEEAEQRPPHTHYIPHFGQVNPNQPENLRLIMEAEANSGGISLSEKLPTGPDLIRPLIAVLWNFRVHKVALTGDADTTRAPDNYTMKVLIFGATLSPSSSTYIKNRNADDFIEHYPDAF